MSDPLDSLLAEVADDGVRARLIAFVRLLAARNAVTNLTAARDDAAFAEHVLDSLTLAPYVRSPFVDVGSGGGFPAVPLAIVTSCRATLIEASAKKAAFLREAAAELGLAVDVVAERAETAAHAPPLRECFAAATARAVGPLSTVLELTLPLLALGGRALLQRGVVSPSEREAAADAALVLGGRMDDEIALGGDRRIIIVEKVAPTTERFPRRTGVPAKRPLCVV